MIRHLAIALRALGRSPVMLCAVCFAASAILLPYYGVKHDAILYGGQVLNRIDPGCLADDLFLRYGSQDKFSAISPVMAPAAQRVGIPVAFLVGYLASVAVYCVGAVRLARALFPEPMLATVAAFALVTLEMPYGGDRVFNVPEGFFTPRLAACGLALAGLERAIAGRWLGVAGCFALAFALHPLMAVGPAAMAGVLFLVRLIGPKAATALIAAAVLAGAGVLAIEPVGTRLFGPMDDEWKQAVRRMTNYNFVAEWGARDWLRTGVAGVIVLMAAIVGRGTPVGRLFATAVVVGVVGMAAFAIAPHLPYALFFQGQSYRAVWVWSVLQLPAALWLAARWWPADGWRRTVAAMTVGTPLLLSPVVEPAWLVAVVAFVAGLALSGGRQAWRAVAVGVGVGLASADAGLLLAIVRGEQDFHQIQDDFAIWPQIVVRLFGPFTRAAVISVVLALCAGVIIRRPRLVIVLGVALGLLVPIPYAVIGDRARPGPGGENRRFVTEFLRTHPTADGRRPSIFWCDRIDAWEVWYHVGARCYHHPVQGSGAIFNRGTALEADRRTELVKRFWLEHAEWTKQVYPGAKEEGLPTVELLRRLASEPDLDWLIVPDNFPEFAPATNGHVFIYDCRAIRGGR